VRILLSTGLTVPQRFIKLDGATGEVISDKTVSLPTNTSTNTNTRIGKRIEKLDFENIKTKITEYIEVALINNESYISPQYEELINDTFVRLIGDKDIYQKTTKKMNSTFTNFKSYYRSNYQLATETNKFSGFNTGLQKFYDEDGNLIQVRDYDENFPFSVEMLIDKFKKEYNIDLLIPNKKQLVLVTRRYEANSNWTYEIRIRLYPYPNTVVRIIMIDGSTGELISDEIDSKYYNIK
jgi:hypothetical protein